jgi:hypothetical protein
MREHGLEWLFRLLQEPRRLWRRYLVYGAQFPVYLAVEGLRQRYLAAREAPKQRIREKEPRGHPQFSHKYVLLQRTKSAGSIKDDV